MENTESADRAAITVSKTNCNKLLQSALKRILELPQMKVLKLAIVDINQQLKMSSDLKKIAHKIENHKYLSSDDFLVDLAQMKENSFSELSDKKRLLQRAEEFYVCCETDGRLIKSCAECFLNELSDETDKWFTQTCSKPHLLVTVKLNRCPYFPAKIMGFDKETVFVRLFEELSVADVPYEDCLLYKKRTVPPKLKQRRTIVKAADGANLYIESIISKFGQYNYGDYKTPLTAENITLHLRNMTAPVHLRESAGATSEKPTSSSNHDESVYIRTKRIKLERDTHLATDVTLREPDTTDDERDDLASTAGNAGDESNPLEDIDITENICRESGLTSTARVNITRIREMSSMSVRYSPPRLRDFSSISERSESSVQSSELEKLKRDHQLEISCMTKSFNEILKAMRSEHASELLEIVEETKKKQWCSNCWKEAKLYCCWQTSYCDNLCQRKHWPQHAINCANERSYEQRQQE